MSQANDTKTTRIDLDDLIEQVEDSAHIAVLVAGATTWAFSESVPEGFRSYGGGTRLVWPYATRNDSAGRHPLYITKTAEDSPRSIRYAVRDLRTRGFLPEPEKPDVTPPWQSHTEPSADRAPASRADQLATDLAFALERNIALASENADLRKTVHSLTDQVGQLEQRLHGTNLYSDPAEQIRHEIEHAWLLTYDETDREQHPLADYSFGTDFIHSVTTIEGVEREKIISTCVDVLTRRAWEVNGRQARQLRATAAAGSHYLVRPHDGAAAWRCNIQTGTASARRLMWWERTDQTIELAVVALHDDISIR